MSPKFSLMKSTRLLFILFVMLSAPAGSATDNDRYAAQRQQMVEEIAADARRLVRHIDKDSVSDRVMQAMATVPRHRFVPTHERPNAYENRPLPIGYGQTISQPYIVALMTRHAQIQPGDKVLEVGTGCGYQTAVLAAVGADVYSIEIVEPLATITADRLNRLGYPAKVRAGDGYEGWASSGHPS